MGEACAFGTAKPTDGMILLSELRSGGRNTAVGEACAFGAAKPTDYTIFQPINNHKEQTWPIR
ncbi:MAG: hypothetical protein J6X49_01780 [Victivallales bacterium]|nr:hypothetical protein [Victivallales bacterium]